jgi:hypothetical protein
MSIINSPALFRHSWLTDPAFAGSVSPYRSPAFAGSVSPSDLLPSPDLFRPATIAHSITPDPSCFTTSPALCAEELFRGSSYKTSALNVVDRSWHSTK